MLRSNRTNSWSFFCAAVLAVLVLISATPAQAQSTIFVVTSANNLLAFSSADPATLVVNVAITGLQMGETIRSMDFRPADGLLYAVGAGGAASPRLYTINTTTGAATQVGADGAFTLAGLNPGVDFNPVVDLLRVVSNNDENFRLNPTNGTVAGTDTNVAFDAGDVNNGQNAIVNGAAYTNNFAGATTTTLFVIDVGLDVLARQGSVGGTPTSPNTGLLFTIGALTVNFFDGAAFDIAQDGTAFATNRVVNASTFHTIDLTTGAASAGAAIGAGNLTIEAMAVAPPGVLQFSAATASVAENAGMVTLSVTRTGGSFGLVGATFDTSDGTALAGFDYTATNGVNVAFADGDATTQTVNVPITNDALDEANETFNGTLSAPTGGALLGANNPVVVTITDDDPPPNISINDVTVAENAGPASFTVSLSAVSGQAVSVTAATAGGTATSGTDFTALPAMTTVTIPAGMMSAPLNVTITNDTLDENNETFTVNLSAPVNGVITDSQGVGTITDDDPPPSITINDVAANEGSNAVFTVTLSAASSFAVSVNFATASGTATAGSDFTTTMGTLNIAAGATTGTITVPLLFDAVADGGETFTVNLTAPVNATIGDAQGVGTINDVAPNFTMTVTPASKSALPGQQARYTVTITPTPFVPSVDVTCTTSIPLGSCTPPGTLTVGSTVTSGILTGNTTGFFQGVVSIPRGPQAPLYAWWLPVSGMGALGLVVAGANRKRLQGNRRAQYLAILSLLLAITLLAGCPLGRDREDEGTPGGTYPITVTATGSGVTRMATVDLVVQGTN